MSDDRPEALSVVIRLEGGAFWATVDEFPGVFATGDTLEELRESLEEGISLYLSDGEHTVRATVAPLTVTPAETAARLALQLA